MLASQAHDFSAGTWPTEPLSRSYPADSALRHVMAAGRAGQAGRVAAGLAHGHRTAEYRPDYDKDWHMTEAVAGACCTQKSAWA